MESDLAFPDFAAYLQRINADILIAIHGVLHFKRNHIG
jgi:hypothetical protein